MIDLVATVDPVVTSDQGLLQLGSLGMLAYVVHWLFLELESQRKSLLEEFKEQRETVQKLEEAVTQMRIHCSESLASCDNQRKGAA